MRSIVPFDTSILATALTPNIQNPASNNAISPEAEAIARRLNTEPDIVPPWRRDRDEEPPPLVRRVNQARNLRNFIDLNSEVVQTAGSNPDRRASFALFQALEHLQALALFASERNTNEASLAALDTAFQRGLGQISEFIDEAELEKLNLSFGERSSSIESKARISGNPTFYSGKVVQTGDLGDPIPGLKGDEKFVIRLRENAESEEEDAILVDLSEITTSLTLTAVTELINGKIKEIPRLDNAGNIDRDKDGIPIPKYRTNFRAVRDSNGDFFIRISGSSRERVTLQGTSSDPSAYVASNFSFLNRTDQTSTRITRIDNIDGNEFVIGSRTDYNSTDIDVSELNRLVAEAENESRNEERDEDDQVEFTPPPDLPIATNGGAIATDRGFVYVVGTTKGDIGGHLGDGEDDVFLTKFDSNGEVIFQKLLSTRGEGREGTSQGYAITVDVDGNVIVAGQTTGSVSDRDVLDGRDSYVVKFTSDGDEVFRYQLDSVADDSAVGLTTNLDGDIFVTGYTQGEIGGLSNPSGERDSYVLRLSGTAGEVLDSTQFGTNDTDQPTAITTDFNGNIFVAANENGNTIIRQVDANDLNNIIATHNLGDLGGGKISSIGVFEDTLVVGGTTSRDISGGGTATNSRGGGTDGFVSRFDLSGGNISPVKTTYIGSNENDSITSIQLGIDEQNITVDKIYITGTTSGSLGTNGKSGITETYFARLDADTGAQEVTQQLGLVESRNESIGAVLSFESEGILGRLGLRAGELTPDQRRDITSQTTVRAGDSFFISINGGLRRRITIREGDTLRSLSFRINVLGFQEISARASSGRLRIAAQDDTVIDLISGPDGKDALKGLGIEPGRITATNILFNTNRDRENERPEDTLGGSFGLNLEGGLHIRDKRTARYVATRIEDAISTVQRAYRSLNFDPIAYTARNRRNTQGPVPEYLTNQIANYQAALQRLQAGNQAAGPNLFI